MMNLINLLDTFEKNKKKIKKKDKKKGKYILVCVSPAGFGANKLL